MEQPTKRIMADDRPSACGSREWDRAALPQALMRAPLVVELAISCERPLRLSLAQDQ